MDLFGRGFDSLHLHSKGSKMSRPYWREHVTNTTDPKIVDTLRAQDSQIDETEREINNLKRIIQKFYRFVIRTMVVLKNLIRVGSVGAVWFWIGSREAYALAGFVVVLAIIQLIIDRVREIANPKLELSEWDLSL
jgi:hypothetical protein